ncbi:MULTISPECIES: DUF1223 domain-containing protein [unclassified Sphingomonas]|uniref:DUF1223 domain-containing protein n=1 Tax=unclassified Sphingomonas TaxID=196159 RepID=UPI0022699755|nr:MULTISPECIES: DUF1223 domain-containing protein [unclassified Sphingomonas]
MAKAALALTLSLVSAATPIAAAPPAKHPQPTVVELFQSQGCSDCPPAQLNLNRIADRPDVIALSFGVTYWDYLGWKDSFASPAFTQRQRDYSARNNGAGVATPQYWINGRTTVLGANPGRVAQLISAGGPSGGPMFTVSGSKATIGAGRAPVGGAEVLLVRYDPRTIQVAIRAGENGGRTIPHRDVVRELRRIGHWSGAPLTVTVPAGDGSLKIVVLLQAGRGGPILSAARG